jgi:predicted RNase H-like nuclease (RuvC/YqgF family)
MSLAAGDTLSKLKEIVIKNEHGYDAMASQAVAASSYVKKYEQLTREELSKTLEEKDGKIRNMQSAIESYEAKVKSLANKNAELHDKIGDLQHELAIEK